MSGISAVNLSNYSSRRNQSFGNADTAVVPSGSTKLQKFAKGTSSFLVPGLGQAVDGRNKKAVKDFVAGAVLTLGAMVGMMPFYRNLLRRSVGIEVLEPSKKAAIAFGVGMAMNVANFIVRLQSAADAYKKG